MDGNVRKRQQEMCAENTPGEHQRGGRGNQGPGTQLKVRQGHQGAQRTEHAQASAPWLGRPASAVSAEKWFFKI